MNRVIVLIKNGDSWEDSYHDIYSYFEVGILVLKSFKVNKYLEKIDVDGMWLPLNGNSYYVLENYNFYKIPGVMLIDLENRELNPYYKLILDNICKKMILS
jgi:hypothetical protein